MGNKWLVVGLLACCGLVNALADTINLVGAWEGPKDLMVNFCEVAGGELSVCHCGIFRTYGWVDVVPTVRGDSLLLESKDCGSPLVGRFHIESDDGMSGVLVMGNPGDDWYFNGEASLTRQKPVLPENINSRLEGTVLAPDYGKLSLDRDMAWEVLSAITPKLYGYGEKRMVERLLKAKVYPISAGDMGGFRRVRSIQIDARYGIFSYPWFNCRFKASNGKTFFEKTTGSQRKSGYVYQNSPESLVFLGGWSVNDDPQTAYGSPNSVAGKVYRGGANRAIMIFPTGDGRVEIYELVK